MDGLFSLMWKGLLFPIEVLYYFTLHTLAQHFFLMRRDLISHAYIWHHCGCVSKFLISYGVGGNGNVGNLSARMLFSMYCRVAYLTHSAQVYVCDT